MEYKATGLIIDKQLLNDYDLVVKIYSLELGKFSAIYKKAKKQAKIMAQLELFNENIFVLSKRKTWEAIYSIDQRTTFSNLRTDYDSFEQACYFAKLLDQITPDLDQNIPLYTLFYNSLSLLNHGQNPKNVREYFQLNTLKIEGLLLPEQKKVTEKEFIRTINEYSGKPGRENVSYQESKISGSFQK